MHTGDDLNALSAWSLVSPALSDAGAFSYTCDGRCGLKLSNSDEMYICRICSDTGFTGDCLEDLRANRLERFRCHPDHTWLRVPKWDEADAEAIGENNIRARGTLGPNGQRVGGEIVDKDIWLDEIRESWGISKEEIIETKTDPDPVAHESVSIEEYEEIST